MHDPAAPAPRDDRDVSLPPTNVRWVILALLMAFAGLCHFNRISMTVAGTEQLMTSYSISETQMGLVYSSYLFIYTLCMTPGGWLIDRIGPRRALLLMGLGSAILVPMTGLASLATAGMMLFALCGVRAMLGAVSAPIHPGAARLVSFWIPYRARGAANGMVTAAALMGIASCPFGFGMLMDAVGWPAAFVVAGVATLGLTAVWWALSTDTPDRHPAVNAGELTLIGEGDFERWAAREAAPREFRVRSEKPAGTELLIREIEQQGVVRGGVFHGGLLTLIRDRNLILLTTSYAMLSYFQYMLFYWIEHYFNTVLKLGKETGRLYATIPLLSMAVGMFLGGWLADRIASRFGARHGRAIVAGCGMAASAVLLILGIAGKDPVWAVTCIALAMGALGATESCFWVTGVELGRRHGGLSAAILNTGGNAGGIPAPYLTPWISAQYGWQIGLGLASVLVLIGAVLWCWIEPGGETASTADNQPEPSTFGTA